MNNWYPLRVGRKTKKSSPPFLPATLKAKMPVTLLSFLLCLLTKVVPATAFPFCSLLASPQQITDLRVETKIRQMNASQEWDVAKYQQQHSFVWEYGSSLVDLVFAEDETATKNLKILDIGCGSGELTARLAERSSKDSVVVGLDADAEMVRTASKQYPALTFMHGDVRNFDLGEETFDIIFSNAALHWVPPHDVDRAVASISRALKPGGRLVVEFGGKGNVRTIEAAVQKLVKDSSPWYFPSVADFTSRLERIGGIETTAALLYDRPTQLEEGQEGLKNWLQMFGQKFWRNVQSEDALDEILTNVESEVKEKLWDGETWTADYRRLRIVARKL